MGDAPSQPVLRPLAGFGWRGWALLPVALALAWVTFSGYDLRYQIIAFVHEGWGWNATSWLVSAVLPGYWFNLHAATFGPAALCWLLIVLHVHPRRRPWWEWALVIAWGLLAPRAWWIVQIHLMRQGVNTSSLASFRVTDVIMLAVMVAGCWALFRSWRVTLAFGVVSVGAFALASVIEGVATPTAPAWVATLPTAIAWVWHGAAFALLLTYAFRARRAAGRITGCHACGYDLAGLAATVCPECGATRRATAQSDAAAAAPAPPPASATTPAP